MATLQSIRIDDVVSAEVKKALSSLKPKVDLNDLFSSMIAGVMEYLLKKKDDRKRDYIALAKKDATCYYMSQMKSTKRPSLCGKMFLINSKYYTIPLSEPEIFDAIIKDLSHYCDIDKTITINDPPFNVNGINVIEEIVKAFFAKIQQDPKVITTFSGYSLIYTVSPYFPGIIIEIHKS